MIINPLITSGFFLPLFWKGDQYGKENFYIGIGNRRTS